MALDGRKSVSTVDDRAPIEFRNDAMQFGSAVETSASKTRVRLVNPIHNQHPSLTVSLTVKDPYKDGKQGQEPRD